MKRSSVLSAVLPAVTALLCWTPPSQAELIGYESFHYPLGTTVIGADGGAFWDYFNVATGKHGLSPSVWKITPGLTDPSIAFEGQLLTANSGIYRDYGINLNSADRRSQKPAFQNDRPHCGNAEEPDLGRCFSRRG